MRISFLLPLVFLGLAGCVDVHEHRHRAGRDRRDTGAGADRDLCRRRPPTSTDSAHALIGADLRIDRGPGNNPALFICAAPWCRRRYPRRLELRMTAPYPAAALEPEVTAPLILALPKGRILAECGQLLARAGVAPAPDYADEESRRLRFPTDDPALDVVRVPPVRRRHLRRLRRRAARHLRRRRADGVRLPGDLRAARSRHRRLPCLGRRTGRDRRQRTIRRAGRACGWPRNIPTSPAVTSPRAACMPTSCI